MSTISCVLGWIGIGLAASLIGMAMPGPRGSAGVAVKLAAGVGGGLAGGLCWRLASTALGHAPSSGFVGATLGAILTLLLYDVVFIRRHPSTGA
jgi:uncharacterized membrane protein YeaQ/YmgE (transglycosylase-associated protein family)